jgi:cold shock CspA family protein
LTGVVSEFDEGAGLGAVTADDGAVYGFHCTQIADGTRTIEVGTRVCFQGRYEAVALSPAS